MNFGLLKKSNLNLLNLLKSFDITGREQHLDSFGASPHLFVVQSHLQWRQCFVQDHQLLN
jgi:hypothetical protein